jgi:hypothetical protein
MQRASLSEATEADAATAVTLLRTAFEEYRGVLDPPSGAHAETEEIALNNLTIRRTDVTLLSLCAIVRK